LLLALGCAALMAGPLGCEKPKPPEVPEKPPPGNCCLRSAEPAEQVCGPERGCCHSELDRDACEAKKGLWFHTPEGCMGVC